MNSKQAQRIIDDPDSYVRLSLGNTKVLLIWDVQITCNREIQILQRALSPLENQEIIEPGQN